MHSINAISPWRSCEKTAGPSRGTRIQVVRSRRPVDRPQEAVVRVAASKPAMLVPQIKMHRRILSTPEPVHILVFHGLVAFITKLVPNGKGTSRSTFNSPRRIIDFTGLLVTSPASATGYGLRQRRLYR